MPDDSGFRPSLSRAQHVEDFAAPTLYVDTCMGGGSVNGDNLVLTFATTILDHTVDPPAPVTKTAARLVLSKGAAADTARFISTLLAKIKAEAEPGAWRASVAAVDQDHQT